MKGRMVGVNNGIVDKAKFFRGESGEEKRRNLCGERDSWLGERNEESDGQGESAEEDG